MNAPPPIMPTVPPVGSLLEAHHLLLIILVLVIALVAGGVGNVIGPLLKTGLRRFFRLDKTEIIQNFNGGQMDKKKPGTEAQCGGMCLIDPKLCPAHQAEYDRSKQNKEDITSVKKAVEDLKEIHYRDLNAIKKGVGKLLMVMVAEGKLKPSEVPEEL